MVTRSNHPFLRKNQKKLIVCVLFLLFFSTACTSCQENFGKFRNLLTPILGPFTPDFEDLVAKSPDEQTSAQPSNQNDVQNIQVIGGWYGPACDEDEGAYVYRWSVDLLEDKNSGNIEGTIKFHDCPEGGRVLYRVTGDPQKGPTYILTGDKKDGGGDLLGSAEQSVTFTFDSAKGNIEPNLAP